MDNIKKFGSGLINFNSSFLNTLIREEFRVYISRLFHLVISAGRKGSLKKLCLILKIGILLL